MENSNHQKGKQQMLRYATEALLLLAVAAKSQAQEAKAPEVDKQAPKTEIPTNTPQTEDKSGISTKVSSGLIASITSHQDREEGKNGTTYYADWTPGGEISFADKHGDFAKVSAVEAVSINNDVLNALNIKFMIEMGRVLGDGSQIVLRAGREATQAGGVYDATMYHEADFKKIGEFGNLSNLLAIRYIDKNGNFGEAGVISPNNDGSFFAFPNMEEPSLWLKGGLQAFNKCTAEVAAKLGKDQKQLLASFSLKTPSENFKARIMGKYDFVERSGAVSAEFLQKVGHDLKLMAGAVAKQHSDYRIHVGVDKGNVQLSGEFVKAKDQKGTFNLTLATQLNWARSKLPK